jgi:hypothetical protein
VFLIDRNHSIGVCIFDYGKSSIKAGYFLIGEKDPIRQDIF